FSIPILFSQDVFYAHRSEKNFHDVLTAIKQNQKVGECASYFFPNGERSFHEKHSLYKMYSGFPDFQKTLMHMSQLNESCQFSLSELRYKYPKEFIPEGYTSQSYLEKVTWDGAKTRYGQHLSASVTQMITKELQLIKDLEF